MGRSRVTLAGVVAVVVASMAGAPSTGDAAAVSAPPDCNPAGVVLSQAPDGRVDACLRVGDLAPGPHMISLQDLLEFGPPARKFLPPGVKRGVRPTPPSEPAVSLSLSPSSGGPGTIVTVRGRLPRPFHPRDSHPNLCWDVCRNGLDYDDPPVRWTSPTAFRTRIIVPAAPWIEGGLARVAPLVSGDYRVAIQCVREVRACASVTEGTATFHLRVTRPPAWCRTQSTCARLRVTPAHAVPGQVVRVTGFAPLAAGETPIASFPPYQMVLTRRRPREQEVRLTGRDGVREATVGLGALDVEPAPRYADLRDVTPLAQVSDSVPQISADPANPGTVAWCAGTTIGVEGPSGTTQIPTAPARGALEALGFSFRSDPLVRCAAVAPIASASGAPAGLAAAFYVTTSAGAPPFYLAALVTRDNGQTWAPIPVPSGSAPAGFGGFRYAGAALEAVFALRGRGGSKAYPVFDAARPVTEASGPDGQSFSQAPLGCPPAGPCVTFGPYQPGNCAMNGTMQTLLRSTDGGRRWSPLGFPYPVQDCGEAELAALSATSGLLVDSTSTYPVLRTTDGGITWRDVALPPHGSDGDLTVLPDGALVMSHGVQYVGRWKLLRHGGRAWCELRTPSPAVQRRSQVSAPVVIHGALWWLSTPSENPDAAPTVNQLPLAALGC